MKSDITSIKTSRVETVRRRLNVILIRVANIEVEHKQPEEISLAEVFGSMGAGDYGILLLSLVVVLIVGFFSGLLLETIWEKPPSELAFLAVIPAVFAGFVICYCLFRIKHWLTAR